MMTLQQEKEHLMRVMKKAGLTTKTQKIVMSQIPEEEIYNMAIYIMMRDLNDKQTIELLKTIKSKKEMLDKIMKQLINLNITDKATCLTVLGRIKTKKQYKQMMNYLKTIKNPSEEMITNKAIEISKS